MDLEKIAAKLVEAGAGPTKEQLYRKIRQALLRSIQEITRKFPNAVLKCGKSEVSGTVEGHEVRLYYKLSYASNGEVAGFPTLVVDGRGMESFSGKVVDQLEKMLAGRTASETKKGTTMNKIAVADELVKIAKELAAVGTTGWDAIIGGGNKGGKVSLRRHVSLGGFYPIQQLTSILERYEKDATDILKSIGMTHQSIKELRVSTDKKGLVLDITSVMKWTPENVEDVEKSLNQNSHVNGVENWMPKE
jgi:hypothetical protein